MTALAGGQTWFGDGSGGSPDFTGAGPWTVNGYSISKSGTALTIDNSSDDPDEVVLYFDNLTLGAVYTLTVSDACKGLWMFVRGTLTMTATSEILMTDMGAYDASYDLDAFILSEFTNKLAVRPRSMVGGTGGYGGSPSGAPTVGSFTSGGAGSGGDGGNAEDGIGGQEDGFAAILGVGGTGGHGANQQDAGGLPGGGGGAGAPDGIGGDAGSDGGGGPAVDGGDATGGLAGTIVIYAKTINITSGGLLKSICSSAGGTGGDGHEDGAGGGGAGGGVVFLAYKYETLNGVVITVNGSAGGVSSTSSRDGALGKEGMHATVQVK